MNNILNFVNHNLMLSVVFILLIIVYTSFEFFNWLSKNKLANQISPNKLILLFNHNNATIIDLRTEDQYNAGHIVGAINIEAKFCNTEHKVIKSNPNKIFILVDEYGKDAAISCYNLYKAGIKEVFYLQGGLNLWRSENMPLVKNLNLPKAINKNSLNNLKNQNIVMYTKEDCPYCVSAKNLLRNKGYYYKEIKIKGTDSNEFREMITLTGGSKTMPQIFINDRHIGGFDALKVLSDKGELDQILITG